MIELIRNKTVTHESLPGASVTIAPASYGISLQRTFYIAKAQEAQGKVEITDTEALSLQFGKNVIYPSLIAATVAHEGFEKWPPSPDELLALPEGFVVAWERAVVSLNPQWFEQPAPDDQEKKD